MGSQNTYLRMKGASIWVLRTHISEFPDQNLSNRSSLSHTQAADTHTYFTLHTFIDQYTHAYVTIYIHV